MPELPEVETVARGLSPVLLGARLAHVEARRPDLRFPLPERFTARLSGAGVTRVGRRGKYLTIDLDTDETWIAHLGMSGRFTITPHPDGPGQAPGRFHHDPGGGSVHDHVVITTDAGARVVYNDPRRFGFMDLVRTIDLPACRHFVGMGPEPLGAAFSATSLGAALAARRTPIKAALLDQTTVAGLGNIYVCEALFRAGIAPDRQAADITPTEIARLVRAVRTVLADAIAAGGSSLRDYAHTDGSLGYFQHAFDVYGREGEPCRRPRCSGVIARTVQSNRSSFACPVCQR